MPFESFFPLCRTELDKAQDRLSTISLKCRFSAWQICDKRHYAATWHV